MNSRGAKATDLKPNEAPRRIGTSQGPIGVLRSQSLDEFPTGEMGTASDSRFHVLNALSRVATHGPLTHRQRSELLRFSGVYAIAYCVGYAVGMVEVLVERLVATDQERG